MILSKVTPTKLSYFGSKMNEFPTFLTNIELRILGTIRNICYAVWGTL